MHAYAETVVFQQDFFDDGSSAIKVVVSTKLKLKESEPGYDQDKLNALTGWVQDLVNKTPGAKGFLIEEAVENSAPRRGAIAP